MRKLKRIKFFVLPLIISMAFQVDFWGKTADADIAKSPLLNLSFEDNKVPEKFIEQTGMSGQCFKGHPQATADNITFEKLSPGDFAVSVWLKIDELPDQGLTLEWDDKTPMTVFTLSAPNSANGLGLRIRKTVFQIVVADDDGKYLQFDGIHSVPLKHWVHLTLSYNANALKMRINGELDIYAQTPFARKAWNQITLGHWNKSRNLNGKLDEIKIFDQPLSREDTKIISTPFENQINSYKLQLAGVNETYEKYKSLKVSENATHPLQEQLDTNIVVLDWKSDGVPCILLSGQNRFASRNAIFTPCDYDDNGMPIYDSGQTYDLCGIRFEAIPREEKIFDMVGNGNATPYGGNHLVYYKNIGKAGSPVFDEPQPISVDGKNLRDALGMTVSAWHIEDITNDGIVDLFAVGYNRENKYDQWPDRKSVWNGDKNQPNSGKGKGYSINGQWLGRPDTTILFWARGTKDNKGTLSFGKFKQVHYQHKGFAVQWKSESANRAVSLITVGGVKYLLHSGSVDEILALPIKLKNGELFCEQAVLVHETGPAISASYYFPKMCVYDIDSDGFDEILMAGNNGRIAVLKGKEMGRFKEVQPLQMKGGSLCVDTLSVPCRVDWDNDGRDDLIVGDSSGLLTCWPGTNAPTVFDSPVYMKSKGKRIEHQGGMTGSIQGPTEKRWGYINPTTGDWNEDGKLDIIACDINSDIVLYEKTKDPMELTSPRIFTHEGKKLPAAWRVRPAILPGSANFHNINYPTLLYLDWDGFAALAIPQEPGSTEIKTSVRLKYESGEDILLCGWIGHWGRTKMSIADWDNDGDWDMIIGVPRFTVSYFLKHAPAATSPYFLENVGTSSNPAFKKPVNITHADGTIIDIFSHVASVWPSDLDNDGKPDLLVGGEDGKVYYFYREELGWVTGSK